MGANRKSTLTFCRARNHRSAALHPTHQRQRQRPPVNPPESIVSGRLSASGRLLWRSRQHSLKASLAVKMPRAHSSFVLVPPSLRSANPACYLRFAGSKTTNPKKRLGRSSSETCASRVLQTNRSRLRSRQGSCIASFTGLQPPAIR